MSGVKRAYCAELEAMNPHLADQLWHPAEDEGARRNLKLTKLAVAVCEVCPLRLQCLSDAIVGEYEDESIYGGMGRRQRKQLAALIEADGIDVRPRDRENPERRRRECIAWLRANPDRVARVGDAHAYWAMDWQRRKRKHEHELVSAS